LYFVTGCHIVQVFKATIVYSTALVDGMDDLRPEDSKKLKQLIEKHSPATKSAGAGAKSAAADGDTDMKAGSTKAKAKKKRAKSDDSDDEGDETPAKSAKLEAQDFSKLSVAQLTAACKAAGLKSSGKKAELVARLEEAAGAMDTSSSPPAVAAAAAAVDPVVAAHEAAIEAEQKALWDIKDAISDLSNNEIKALLQANNQPDKVIAEARSLCLHGAICAYSVLSSRMISLSTLFVQGGRDTLMARLVDGLLYGALPPCPTCNQQSLTFKNGQYECHGMASEWGRCLYTAPDVKRAKFDVSESDHEYLNSKKFKTQVKPIAAHAYFASLNKAATEQHKSLAAEAEKAVQEHQQQLVKQSVLDELFKDFTVGFVGTKFKVG
jgi:hypothetical protein